MLQKQIEQRARRRYGRNSLSLSGPSVYRYCLGMLVAFQPLLGCMQGYQTKPDTPSASISKIVRAQSDTLEVSATPEELARQEVLDTPTEFLVGFDDDAYAWDRARFFLENYTGAVVGHASAVTRVVGDRWSLVSNPMTPEFLYEVSKDPSDTGYLYRVTCLSVHGGSTSDAVLNAGNLARFIRDGKLEVSLLK